ncbi:putative DNA-binding protein [Roseibium hamelinense]|uniref:Putative DNA-binding protein n=1 Tax=Roseibium hamelinense TaxID=150831 RepID=A0A562SLR3_9HYPH|nr:DNA-binding domain-containing protein [Roseibium hamelinense]MTI45004.1 DUF2063 domain-containing protein [Roseibium hamelinense]TWI82267.1 putative DNA-binding protein [Roseibium hamelinense]
MRSEPKLSPNGAFSAALLDAEQSIPTGIVGPDGAPDSKRFNVYRNNVIVSLVEALAHTFPAVQQLVGEEYFAALARSFVIENPPKSPVLIWYGREFGAYLDAFPPLSAYPYLGDVARLEWGWLQSFHSADACPLDPARLASVSPNLVGEVRFEIHPACRMIASIWPVLSLVQANRFGGVCSKPINLDNPEAVLVTRPDIKVQLSCLPNGAVTFFNALTNGKTFSDAAALASFDDSRFELEATLGLFLGQGVFTDLRVVAGSNEHGKAIANTGEVGCLP